MKLAADEHDLGAHVVGRTIVGYEREPDSEEPWPHGENAVKLTLDDGSELHFMGFGYDSSGLLTHLEKPDGVSAAGRCESAVETTDYRRPT